MMIVSKTSFPVDSINTLLITLTHLTLTCEIGRASPLAPSFHPAFLTHVQESPTRKLSPAILQSPTR